MANPEDPDLPECKIKRNYSCAHCSYFTQNPRFYLSHLRDVHGERININNCNLCLYASRHYQKLVRHMKMVHGTTTEDLPGQIRKRPPPPTLPLEDPTDCVVLPPLPTQPQWLNDIDTWSYDLKSSRKTLRDFAAIYFAENEIEEILAKMEASDVVEVVPEKNVSTLVQAVFGDPRYVGNEDLDIICDHCGYVSKSFLDSIAHGKICCLLRGRDIEYEPLDLTKKTLNGEKRKEDLEVLDFSMKIETQDYPNEAIKILTMDFPNNDNMKTPKNGKNDEAKNSTNEAKEETRKVFKCPLCSFWASTASRFHVHIVGHQNKKSFKCSLCTYCSNWRWDITKHIRVKSIRTPSHKNARILMLGDNGGRRNYTKYDKYITSMKISDKDWDLRWRKCGELDFCDLEEKKANKQNDLKISPKKVQTTEIVNKTPSSVKEVSPRAFLIYDEVEVNPVYKCSKCRFSHSNRDAVLVHIKIQHQDLLKGNNSSSSTEEQLKTPKIKQEDVVESSKIKQEDDDNSTVEKKETTEEDAEILVVDDDPWESMQISNEKQSTPKTKTTEEKVECKQEIFEVASEKPRNSSNNESVELKSNPPYRCWHCHQVSNWKHVIQRHCRLKHSGSIRVEFIDQSVDMKKPTYRMLNLSNELQVSSERKKPNTEKKNEEEKKSAVEIAKPPPSNDGKIKKFKCSECPFVGTNERAVNQHHTKTHKREKKQQEASEKSEADLKKNNKPPLSEANSPIWNAPQNSPIPASHENDSNTKTKEQVEPNTSVSSDSPTTNQKNENSLLNNKETEAVKNPEPEQQNQNIEKNITSDVQNDKFPKMDSAKFKKPVIPPEVSPRKTIFVNPKTGKVVRKN